DNTAKHPPSPTLQLSPARHVPQIPQPAPGEPGQAPVSRHYSRPDVYSTSPANCVAEAPSSPSSRPALVHCTSDSAALDPHAVSSPTTRSERRNGGSSRAQRGICLTLRFSALPRRLRYLFSYLS